MLVNTVGGEEAAVLSFLVHGRGAVRTVLYSPTCRALLGISDTVHASHCKGVVDLKAVAILDRRGDGLFSKRRPTRGCRKAVLKATRILVERGRFGGGDQEWNCGVMNLVRF